MTALVVGHGANLTEMKGIGAVTTAAIMTVWSHPLRRRCTSPAVHGLTMDGSYAELVVARWRHLDDVIDCFASVRAGKIPDRVAFELH